MSLSLVYFQTTRSFQFGIVIPYLILLLVSIYFSLDIVCVAIKTSKQRCVVAPAPARSSCKSSSAARKHADNDKDSESVLTVSKIVEQKEVFEKRYKFRKVSTWKYSLC